MVPDLYVEFQNAQQADEEPTTDDKWDANIEKCKAAMPLLPSVARNFIDKVPCLHDWRYSFLTKGDKQAALLVTPEGWVGHKHLRWKLFFHYESISEARVFVNEPLGEPDPDTGFVLYDEFHFDDGKLSWHFFDNYGREYAIDGIKSILWADESKTPS
tara:strand:+ start:3359 stop:3832 length:474 start_codon:yes stop_codon:yes gene_type:complete